jgi:creatinine amidohydrolase
MDHELRSATWPTVPQRCTVLLPVGSIEQHGPHLPLDTDSVIATAVANRAAAFLADTHPHDGPFVVAPTITYGASGEHQSFSGTTSLGTETLRLVVVELVRSLRTWASRVVLVNGHGGNVPALEMAVSQLCEEGHDVSWQPCSTGVVDAHAGYSETSLMLYLDPQRVRPERAVAGNTKTLRALMPAMLEGGVRAVSINGVLGDPVGATAEEGARALGAIVRQVVADVLDELVVTR